MLGSTFDYLTTFLTFEQGLNRNQKENMQAAHVVKQTNNPGMVSLCMGGKLAEA